MYFAYFRGSSFLAIRLLRFVGQLLLLGTWARLAPAAGNVAGALRDPPPGRLADVSCIWRISWFLAYSLEPLRALRGCVLNPVRCFRTAAAHHSLHDHWRGTQERRQGGADSLLPRGPDRVAPSSDFIRADLRIRHKLLENLRGPFFELRNQSSHSRDRCIGGRRPVVPRLVVAALHRALAMRSPGVPAVHVLARAELARVAGRDRPFGEPGDQDLVEVCAARRASRRFVRSALCETPSRREIFRLPPPLPVARCNRTARETAWRTRGVPTPSGATRCTLEGRYRHPPIRDRLPLKAPSEQLVVFGRQRGVAKRR